MVWGAYFLGRSGVRLLALLLGGVGSLVLVTSLTGTPVMLGLIAWSIWYAIRKLSDDAPDAAAHTALREADA